VVSGTGTTLRYKPGIVTGGSGFVHECGTSRAIGWFLEPLTVIALYGKKVRQWRDAGLLCMRERLVLDLTSSSDKSAVFVLCVRHITCHTWRASLRGDCSPVRLPCVSWPEDLLAWRQPRPVGVQPLAITLRGITNDGRDPSVDTWRAVTLPLLRQLTDAEGGFDLKLNRRGAPPSVRCSPQAFPQLSA